MLGVEVTPASVSDPASAKQLFLGLGVFCKGLRKVWANGTYRGQFLAWVSKCFRFRVEPVIRPKEQKGFAILLRRWVVEKPFLGLMLIGV